jgi:hypothetical protein
MSPLKHLFRIVGLYLPAAAVLAAPAIAIWLWGGPQADMIAWKVLATWFLIALSAACLVVALFGAVQAMPLLAFRNNPERLLDQLKRDLDSPRLWQRRRVLQVLADYYDHPFGRVWCWPVSLHSPTQVRNMTLLYKDWLRVKKKLTRDGTLLPHVVRRMPAPAKIAVWDKLSRMHIHALRGHTPFLIPPVSPDQVVAELRGRVEDALRRVAEIINEARPRELADAEGRIRDVLGDLVWDALSSVVRLSLDAAAEAPKTHVPPSAPLRPTVEAALDRANDAVKDAIFDLGIEDDEAAPYPERRPLPPFLVDRFAAAVRPHIDPAMKAAAERVNAARDLEGIAAADEEVRRLFEALAGTTLELAAGLRVDAAADGLPWSAAHGEWARKLRRMAALDSVVEGSRQAGDEADA